MLKEENSEDRILVCKYCGRQFTWTAAEQAYYRDRYLAQPKTCPDHRVSARRRHQVQEVGQ